MAEEAHVPDELRCKRSDGRGWRCKRRSMPGKLLCDSHYQQHRATSTSRKSGGHKRPSENPPAAGIRVPGREHLDRRKKRKHSWALDIMGAYCLVDDDTSGVCDDSNKQLNSPKKDPEKKTSGKNKAVVAATNEQVTRDLPHGHMSISPPPPSVREPTANAHPPAKLGLNPPDCRLVNPKFRSKNIDPPPISTVKVVPYAENVRGKARNVAGLGERRKCHWCQRNCDVSLIKCLTCKNTSFCSDCMKARCIDSKEIERRCIVCRKTCECNSCLTNRSKDARTKLMLQESSENQKKVRKHHSFHYLITLVLPILEQINEDKRAELEKQAKLKGQILSKVVIGQVETDLKKQISCNKCSSLILDMHRSCPSCSYKLCLPCCQKSRSLMLGVSENPSEKKSVSGSNAQTKKKQANKSRQIDGNLDSENLFCPSLELGGCGRCALDLRCVFPLNYTTELEMSAKEIIFSKEYPQILDTSLHCSLCSAMAQEDTNKKELLEASRRKHPGDNFLYSPSIHDDHETLLVHFQNHWRNSHPVVVRDLLDNACSLTWNPMALFSNYLKMCISSSENDKEETDDPNCMDWYEVEFSTDDSFSGSMLKTVHLSCETLKLKARLSSALSQRVFADHYAEFIEALPIQEYTNPSSGILNVAAKSAEDSLVSEFSPHVYIACGSAEEIRRGKLVAELRYSSHDLVNVLVHASKFPWSSDQVNKTKTLMRMKSVKDMGGFLDDMMSMDHSEDHHVGAMTTSTPNTLGSETESDSSVMYSGTSDSHVQPICEKFLVDPTEPSTLRRPSPSGVQWDVFRRQDAPKLLEYIQKHSDEFYISNGSSKQVTDPLLNGNFFLDSAHKMKLKDEFKIEPWTFTQKLGEAVLVPAGCPYQMRNLESCVNVALGFISPENATESIKLIDKHHALSTDHKTIASKLEVLKMVINKTSEAIEELRCET